MTTTAIDIGNGYVKAITSDKPVRYPSWVAEISPDDVNGLANDSALITYISGSRQDLIGKTWLTGTSARDYAPNNVLRVLDSERNQGKVELGLQLLLAAAPNGLISNLVTSLPDAQIKAEAMKCALQGNHCFTRNGLRYNLSISSVHCLEEGEGAIAYAAQRGVIRPEGFNALLDLGCGTAILSAFAPGGSLIQKSRLVMGELGVAALAKAIAGDKTVRQAIGGHAREDLILAGIENNSCEYGTTGINFREQYEQHRRAWLKAVLAPAIKHLAPWKDQISRILICGGGARIAAGIVTNSSIVCCPDAQLANLLGMKLKANAQTIQGVA